MLTTFLIKNISLISDSYRFYTLYSFFLFISRFTSLMTSPEEQSKQENQRRSDEVKEKRKAELRGLTEQQLIAQIKLLKERAYR